MGPSNRKKFFSWMRRLSGKRENKVEKEAVAGVSPGRGSVVAEVCNTCREVLEERRSSSQLFGSCEMKAGWGGEWRGDETRWGGEYTCKEGTASRGESEAGIGVVPERDCCGARLTQMYKQAGEERADQRCLRQQDQGERRHLRHTASERNLLRMGGR